MLSLAVIPSLLVSRLAQDGLIEVMDAAEYFAKDGLCPNVPLLFSGAAIGVGNRGALKTVLKWRQNLAVNKI